MVMETGKTICCDQCVLHKYTRIVAGISVAGHDCRVCQLID